MVTMREYAEGRNISYEAVRKQVKRYTAELEGHITKKNRNICFDDYAIEFLDSKRRYISQTVTINDTESNETKKSLKSELEALRAENKSLNMQIIAFNEVVKAKDEVIQSKESLIREKDQRIELLEDNKLMLEAQLSEHKPWYKKIFRKH